MPRGAAAFHQNSSRWRKVGRVGWRAAFGEDAGTNVLSPYSFLRQGGGGLLIGLNEKEHGIHVSV